MKLFLWGALVFTIGIASLIFYNQQEIAALEAQYPPLGDKMSVAASDIHYLEKGSGPVLVLIHGSTTTLRDFTASIFEPLAESCRVIGIDRPGHGYSGYPSQFWMNPEQQADAIHQVLQRLGITHSIWLGHSWGGSVVMAGLLNYPRTIHGGILLGGAAYPWQGGVDWTNHIENIPIIGPAFTHTALLPLGRLLMEDAIEGVFWPDQTPPDYRQNTGIELILRPSHFAFNSRDVRYLSKFLETQKRRYPDIRQPLLLIHGEDDDIVPAWNHADRLIKILPQAVLHRLPSTGHAPHHTKTDRVVGLIREFACSAG